MTDYVLEVKSYAGLLSYARHFVGIVKGPHPESCHGGTRFNGSGDGKWTCSEGHPMPDREEWTVNQAWTEADYERYSDAMMDLDGPQQFTDRRTLIDMAVKRFRGALPVQWWEDEPIPGKPGDRLYYHWTADMVLPESFTDEERERRDGLPLPGDLLAEIAPEVRPGYTVLIPRSGKSRPYRLLIASCEPVSKETGAIPVTGKVLPATTTSMRTRPLYRNVVLLPGRFEIVSTPE
jgi:hypothetical protein